jgi:hypothetical protein
MHSRRSHDAVIRVNDAAGNMIETHEHVGDFKSRAFFQAWLSAFIEEPRQITIPDPQLLLKILNLELRERLDACHILVDSVPHVCRPRGRT